MSDPQSLKDVPEFFEVDIGESLQARTDALGTFRELGPPDLVHIIKSGKAGNKDIGSYHYISGVDASSSASVAAYLNSLTYNIESTSTWLGGKAKSEWKITRACFCSFNAFSRVDVRVEVKIPGGVEAYVLDQRNERHALNPRLWTEVYLSALLRAILYADDATYRLAGYRKLDPIKTLEDEIRFLSAAEQCFPQGWQLGSEPEIQVASIVNNHLTSGIMKYFGESFRFQPAVNLFEKLVIKNTEVASLLGQAYVGMNEEVKAVQILHTALKEHPQSYNLLHVQCDFLRSKNKTEWALKLAKSAVNCAPSEFVTWAKLTEVNIDLQNWNQALLTLNSCPMFTFNERDLHRMPTPSKTHLPIKQFIIDSGILDPPTSSASSQDSEDENLADPTLLRLPAPSLRGTFKEAYRLLTKLVSVIGWDELLKSRSQVFVMEEEYRMQKTNPGEVAETHGIQIEEETADDTASTTAIHEEEDRGRMSVPSSPIPTIKVSSESDGERERLAAAGILSPSPDGAQGLGISTEDLNEEKDIKSDLANDAPGLEKPVSAAAEEGEKNASSEISQPNGSSNLSFSTKRLCERWLDNLFMVLYEDLRVLTVWRAEMAHFKAQHMPYRKTATEWEILGDLALRLHRKEEAKEAYQRSLDQKFSAKAWLELLTMYVDEKDVPRALNAATRIATYNHRWYHESAYPSAVGHQIFRLIQKEGISKVSYSLVSMRLPDPILKIMQSYFACAQTFRTEGSDV